jgi:hypothetical protein
VSALEKIRNLFRRKPLTEDRVRAREEAKRVKDECWIDRPSYSGSDAIEIVAGSPAEATCAGHRNQSQPSYDSHRCSSQEREAPSLKPRIMRLLSLAPGPQMATCSPGPVFRNDA